MYAYTMLDVFPLCMHSCHDNTHDMIALYKFHWQIALVMYVGYECGIPDALAFGPRLQNPRVFLLHLPGVLATFKVVGLLHARS